MEGERMTTGTTLVKETFLEMSHGRTRYLEAGSGEPTILLHGAQFLGGADSWIQVMPALAQRLRVLAPDSLNWGPGDVFDQEFSFAYLVDHVREFMDLLHIERANIVGHSMGGWIATLLAYESPNRVNKLVLSDAGGTANRPLQNMVDFKVPSPEQVTNQVSQRLGKVQLSAPLDMQHFLQEYLDKAAKPEQGEAFAKVMRHMTNPTTRQRYNTLRRLPFITAPTLVTWGSEDRTNDISLGRELSEGIKGSRLAIFEGAGHQVPQEQPAEWAKETLAFLAG
jgi:pimeloyl-ACP methyl ester carboxylesterase